MAPIYSRARVVGNPEGLSKGKVSDHAALVVTFLPGKIPSEFDRPIRRHSVRSPMLSLLLGSIWKQGTLPQD
eukprot:808661-Pyramimonas_sp.AAC.1